MDGKKIKKRIVKLGTKKNFLLVIIFTIIATSVAGLYTVFFVRPMFHSEVQLTYSIENSASKDEVNAKTILLKSYKRILVSEANLKRIKNDIESKGEDINVEISTLKKMINIVLEQDELILTIKMSSNEESMMNLLTDEISTTSINFIDEIYNKKNELSFVSKTLIKKESKNKILVRNVLLGSIMSFVLSLSFIIIKNNVKEP